MQTYPIVMTLRNRQTVVIGGGPVTDYATAAASDLDAFRACLHEILAGGVYVAASQFEAMFVSAAHTDSEIAQTIEVAAKAFAAVGETMGK